MSKIIITNDLVVGHEEIDRQHRNLINILNGLIQATINGIGKESMSDICIELKNYTEYHFATEEKFMEEINYPELEQHKAQHRRLVYNVEKIMNQVDDGLIRNPQRLADFICSWIIDHIKGEDMKIKRYLSSTPSTAL